MGTDWEHIARQLRVYRRNLIYLRDQEAGYRSSPIPQSLIKQITATEEKIAELEEVLRLAKE